MWQPTDLNTSVRPPIYMVLASQLRGALAPNRLRDNDDPKIEMMSRVINASTIDKSTKAINKHNQQLSHPKYTLPCGARIPTAHPPQPPLRSPLPWPTFHVCDSSPTGRAVSQKIARGVSQALV